MSAKSNTSASREQLAAAGKSLFQAGMQPEVTSQERIDRDTKKYGHVGVRVGDWWEKHLNFMNFGAQQTPTVLKNDKDVHREQELLKYAQEHNVTDPALYKEQQKQNDKFDLANKISQFDSGTREFRDDQTRKYGADGVKTAHWWRHHVGELQ